ncbi:MAG: hypothetical protein AAGD25_05735 [Cyanobacteria bacterium P01_F01_bin.150]
MQSTELLLQNLGRLRQDGQDAETSLDALDDAINAIRDDLDAAKELATKARGLSTTASSLETISQFLSTAPIVGLTVRTLTPAFERLESSADTIADYAERLDNRIKPIRNQLRSLESKVEDAEGKVSIAVANLLVYEEGAKSLDDAFPSNTPQVVKSIVNAANDLLEPTADTIDILTDTLLSTREQIQGPLDLLVDAIAPFNQALDVAVNIETILGPLNEPLQSLNSGLRPFEFLFDGLDFIVNRTLSPIIDPILESTGLDELINRFNDTIDPFSVLTNPVENAINGLTGFGDLGGDIDLFNGSLDKVADILSNQLADLELDGLFPLDAIATGDDFSNLFSGTDVANFFQGFAKRDILIGGDGDDTLDGGAANDILVGDDGNDVLIGGRGNDKLSGGEGNDRLEGKGGKDRLDGGEGNDILLGGGGKDRLLGSSGEDELTGGGGKDYLRGGGDSDRLDGGGGRDTLDGGEGDDILTGGGGRDWFVLAKDMGTDMITDFERGQDRIRLIKGLSFSQLSFSQQNGGVLIQSDNQSLGIVEGIASLNASDFA